MIVDFLHVEDETMTLLCGQITVLTPLSSPKQGCLSEHTWLKLSLINGEGELSKELNLLIFVLNH